MEKAGITQQYIDQRVFDLCDENRGLNPYIEDVARRAAVEGFLALAPDGLFPLGGYPGNDDDGREMQAKLDQAKLRTDMLKSAGVSHEMHQYAGTQHGFHNNSTPRYHEAAAKLSWERTVGFFRKHLA